MVKGTALRERVKVIPEQVFAVPTEQVSAEKCQELFPAPSNSQSLNYLTLSIMTLT